MQAAPASASSRVRRRPRPAAGPPRKSPARGQDDDAGGPGQREQQGTASPAAGGWTAARIRECARVHREMLSGGHDLVSDWENTRFLTRSEALPDVSLVGRLLAWPRDRF